MLLLEKLKNAILQIMNKIYKTRSVPKDFRISTFIPVFNKSLAKKCFHNIVPSALGTTGLEILNIHK